MTNSGPIEKIRDLLKLADGAANEHEAAAALTAAQRLMAKHRLERAEIEALGTERPEAPVREQVGARRYRIQPWERLVFASLCEVNDCAPLAGGGASDMRLIAVGTTNDVRAVAYMHAFIVRTIERLGHEDADRERAAGRFPTSGNWGTWHQEYRTAAAIRVARRVDESAHAARAEAAVTASRGAIVALRGPRERAEEEARRASGGMVLRGTVRDGDGRDPRARQLGDAAGRQVDLGRSSLALGTPREQLR